MHTVSGLSAEGGGCILESYHFKLHLQFEGGYCIQTRLKQNGDIYIAGCVSLVAGEEPEKVSRENIPLRNMGLVKVCTNGGESNVHTLIACLL